MPLDDEIWCPWCVLDGPNSLKSVAESLAQYHVPKKEIFLTWQFIQSQTNNNPMDANHHRTHHLIRVLETSNA